MNTRDKILSAIAANQPASVALPAISMFAAPKTDLIALFESTLKLIGGVVIRVTNESQISDIVSKQWECGKIIYGSDKYVNTGEESKDTHSLADTTVAVINGILGVAENGAIWVDERSFAPAERVLPFICENLVVVLYADQLVANMHESYYVLKVNKTGYGCFISGPSKTADIEQSLVIGAHGAKTITVFIVDSDISQ